MSLPIYKVTFVPKNSVLLSSEIVYHVEANDWTEAGKKATARCKNDWVEDMKDGNFIIGKIELTNIQVVS